MNPDILYIIEGRTYESTSDTERQIFAEMKANHKPDSVVVCRERKSFIEKLMFWKKKKILDELELQDLI